MHRFSELRYINRFACLGPNCPDHCCKDWRITIDRDTERRYRSLEESDLKRRILTALTKSVDKNGNKQTCIKVDAAGVCPMFGANGLCGIQAELGEDYLSHTCATFPRLLTGTTRHGFRAGTIACPEVAREVLQSPDAMAEVSPDSNGDLSAPVYSKPATGPAMSLDESAMVRTAMLKILTTTAQPWLGRVTLATLFCDDLGRLDLVRGRSALTTLVLRMHEVMAHADLGELVAADDDPADTLLLKSFVLMMRIVTSRDTWTGKGPSQRVELVQSAIAGLQRDGTDLDTVTRTFRAVHRARLAPELEASPHLRGNLFANMMLQRKFPHGRPKLATRQLWESALCFTLWRVLLAGRLAHDQGPFETEALAVTHGLGRLLMHHPSLIDTLYDAMHKRGLVSNPTLIALLR